MNTSGNQSEFTFRFSAKGLSESVSSAGVDWIMWLFLLVTVCVLQFSLIFYFLAHGDHRAEQVCSPRNNDIFALSNKRPDVLKINAEKELVAADNVPMTSFASKEPVYQGVAATLLVHQPLWFQRRYTMMIQNIHANIPMDWVIQIFFFNDGTSMAGLDNNPGIYRFVRSGRVILTEIPKSILKKKRRRIELMVDPWIWEHMLAESVLIFSGTSVLCSNTRNTLSNFTNFDYIGAPWDNHRGRGGDGEVSFRSRSLMLQIIRDEMQKHPEGPQREDAYKSWGREDHFFVSKLVQLPAETVSTITHKPIKIASRAETLQFAGIGSALNDNVFAVSGTLPSVSYQQRDQFLMLCPEMKLFYPPLHDPNCFGAHPDGDKCALSICALQGKKKGGC